MTTSQRLALIAAIVYVLGSVVAFGHAVNNCTVPLMAAYGGGTTDCMPGYGLKVVGATIAWPWYLSTVAFRPARVEAP